MMVNPIVIKAKWLRTKRGRRRIDLLLAAGCALVVGNPRRYRKSKTQG
jgi:hypothetical protein